MADDAIEFTINAKDNASSVLGGVGKGFAALTAAVTATAAAVAATVKQSAEMQDSMLKLSQRANMSVEAFSELAHAGDLADVSAERIVQTLSFIGRNATEAAYGVRSSSEQFERLGIAVTNADGSIKTSKQLLGDLAEVVKVNGASAEVMAAGMQIAGRGFNEMIPLLRGGREALQGAADDAKFLGISLNQQAAANAEKFNDELTRLKGATQGASNAFSNELIPVLSGVVRSVTDAISRNREFFKDLGQGAATAVVYAIASFEWMSETVSKIWSKIKGWFSSAQGFDDFVENSKRAFGYLFDVAAMSLQHLGVIFLTGFKLAWESFVEIGKWAWQKIFDFISGQDVAGTLGEVLFNRIPEATAQTREEFRGIMGQIKTEWVDTASTMGGAISDTFGVSTDGISIRAEQLRSELTAIGTAEISSSASATEQLANDLLRRLEARRQFLSEKQALIATDIMTEQEAEAIKYEQQAINLRLALENKYITETEYYRLTEQAATKHQASMGNLWAQGLLQRKQFEQKTWNEQTTFVAGKIMEQTSALAGENKKMFYLNKAASMANAIVSTYEGATKALALGPFLGPVMAAIIVAAGMANVAKIKSQEFQGQAHAGMTSVPNEGTFLLDKGERVISPEQNRDLTTFLSGGDSGGGVHIENLTIHVLENATSFDSLMNLSERQLQEMIAGKFYPAIAVLDRRGIRPSFVERYAR